MDNEKIQVGEKSYNVHPMLAVDFDRLQEITDNVERMRVLHTTSSDLSVDEYNQLILIDRNKFTKAINKINGWSVEDEKEDLEVITKKKD